MCWHFIYDEDNERYVYLSEGCARIFGSTVEAYKARISSAEDDLEDIIAEDRSRVREEYRHYMETGEDCAVEFRMRQDDGAIRWIRELTRAKLIKGGRVRQTLGVVRDITDRRELEEALHDRQDELETIYKGMIDGLLIADAESQRFVAANPSVCQMLN